MEVRRLTWRRANVEKLATHGITQQEVLEVLQVDHWVVYVHPDYPDEVRIVGPTRSGRLITVALDPTDEPDRWRPITGWGATAGEIEYHRQEWR